ncbi:DUF4376 domain-containing protein [Aquipseudomonas campi]
MRFAIVNLGVVVNVVEGIEPLGDDWVASDTASIGDYYDDGLFRAPSFDWPLLIAARRYKAEVAGISVVGMQIDTDDRSKTLIAGAALAAMRNPDYVLNWKTSSGFVQLNSGQVLAVADAVHVHVQACFDREAELLALGDSITVADIETGWPEI